MRARQFGLGDRGEARLKRGRRPGLKTDLHHLPRAKQAELAFAVDVLKDGLAKALATRRSPELDSGSMLKIVLFGSYARAAICARWSVSSFTVWRT